MLLASSQVVEKVDEAFLWIGGISLVLLIGITLAMFWFIFRYRRTKHPKPSQVGGNTALEITWILIPTVIVLFMFWKGYEGFALMRDPPPDAMIVKVEARQWAWSFHYPDADVTTSELYVPVDTPVKLLLTAPADDVVHSFYLPAFRTKEDCVPGAETYMWFQADRISTYNIFCAEFCGKDHSRMISRLHVLSSEDYEAWLEAQIARRFRPVDIAVAKNPEAEEIRECEPASLYATYCASCHGREGYGGLVEGARNFHEVADWKRGVQLDKVFRTLTEGIDGTQMRSFTNLSAWDRFALAHYVRGFSAGKERPESTDEELAKLVSDYKLDEQPVIRREFPIEDAMRAMAEEAERGGR